MYFGYNYIYGECILEDFHEYPLPKNFSPQFIMKLDLCSIFIELNPQNKIMTNLHKIGNPWKQGQEIWSVSKYQYINYLHWFNFLKIIQGLFWVIIFQGGDEDDWINVSELVMKMIK